MNLFLNLVSILVRDSLIFITLYILLKLKCNHYILDFNLKNYWFLMFLENINLGLNFSRFLEFEYQWICFFQIFILMFFNTHYIKLFSLNQLTLGHRSLIDFTEILLKSNFIASQINFLQDYFFLNLNSSNLEEIKETYLDHSLVLA